jgi:hypothetical protein
MPDVLTGEPVQSEPPGSSSGDSGGLDLQALLAAQAGGGQDGGLDVLSLLAAQGGSGGPADERLQLALRWLEQRRAAGAESDPADAALTAAEVELQRIEELRQQREAEEQRRQEHRLKKMMTSMYTELEALRVRSDTLAAALGACYLCFGEDLSCPACMGQGAPGALLPDAAAFRQYVAPAVNRIRARPPASPPGRSPRPSPAAHVPDQRPHLGTPHKEDAQ